MNLLRQGAKFRIDFRLLQDEWEPAPWINLGDWSETWDYRQACRNLAFRLGRYAGLEETEKLLELACGYGASLWLWQEEFEVPTCDAVELQQECIDFIRTNPPDSLDQLLHSSVEQLFYSHSLEVEKYDALICVDAAYHFFSFTDFLDSALSLLKPQGRLAFHMLVQNHDTPLPWFLEQFFKWTGINPHVIRTEADLKEEMRAKGWEQVLTEDLSHSVLGGFSRFVQRRGTRLNPMRKISHSWLKICAVAWLCRKILEEGSPSYLLVRATRRL